MLQIRASQQSITANLWALIAHIYHVMNIVISGFSKKSFFNYYFEKHIFFKTQMFFKTGAIRNFAIFTRQHVYWSFFLRRLFISTSSQKRLQPRCFPEKIAKILFYRTPPVPAFASLKKTVQWCACADLLILNKTKVLNNSFNWFVYKFYQQSILNLEEYLLKWWNTNLI